MTFTEVVIKRMGGLIETANKDSAWEMEAAAEMMKAVHLLRSVAQAPANCDCGFSADVCKTNPCMRKKMATSRLNPDAKYPYCGSLSPAKTVQQPLAAAIAEYSRAIRRNSSGGDDYPWETMTGVADALDEILKRYPAQARPSPTDEDIYACCRSTLIGFRDELTEQQIKFICDQIARKSTLTSTPSEPAQAERTYAQGVADANEMVGALWSDLFNKDMVNRGADQFFDKWRDRIKALSVSSTMQLCPDWRTCKCKDGCAHSSTDRGTDNG